jgi:hypothetical protein
MKQLDNPELRTHKLRIQGRGSDRHNVIHQQRTSRNREINPRILDRKRMPTSARVRRLGNGLLHLARAGVDDLLGGGNVARFWVRDWVTGASYGARIDHQSLGLAPPRQDGSLSTHGAPYGVIVNASPDEPGSNSDHSSSVNPR